MFESLQSNFLVAMPSLNNSFFERAVIYICQHDESGAMGIIINRQISNEIDDLLTQLDIISSKSQDKVDLYLGGPVHQEHGFILHQPTEQEWDTSITMSNNVIITTSKDIIEAIIQGTGPENPIIALGYAGWGQGQLESEIFDNAWIKVNYTPEIMFDCPPSQKWNATMKSIGITNPAKLSGFTGHA
ncbi:MAG: putative transcriptional regulator [Francisellaceae bacterium]|jgi:putative transcriptional regulator